MSSIHLHYERVEFNIYLCLISFRICHTSYVKCQLSFANLINIRDLSSTYNTNSNITKMPHAPVSNNTILAWSTI